MQETFIGAGNMGGAIARGLAHGQYIDAGSITVSNPSNAKLEKLKEEYPEINITNNNKEAADGADIVILAVKPWKMEEVLKPLTATDSGISCSRTYLRGPGSFC